MIIDRRAGSAARRPQCRVTLCRLDGIRNRERPVKTTGIMITVAMITVAAIALCGSVSAQQQSSAGTTTGINRLTGRVAIRPTQSETVGSNTAAFEPAPSEEFKVKDRALLDAVHSPL